MIEIMLSDGCKLGKCVFCYKCEGVDAPVAAIKMEDIAVTLGVSHWPVTGETKGHSNAIRGICGRQSGTGTGSSAENICCHVSTIPPTLRTDLFIISVATDSILKYVVIV
jgi:hypothetical protein